jgi:hypothetical protein
VSTSELIVRGPDGASTDFDYIVYGLRVGFEALPIVQVKRDEAYLPTAATLAELEAGQADTVASSALARYRATHEVLAGAPADLSRANVLATRINAGREEWLEARTQLAEQHAATRRAEPGATADAPLAPAAERSPAARGTERRTAIPARTAHTVEEAELPTGTTLVLQATRAIEKGAVVCLDPLHPGGAVESSAAGEPLVVGCALANGDGLIEIATAGVALCRANTTTAPIDVGDLLIASPLTGQAMKHDGNLPAAAILGRAVDPLPLGGGLIRVLLGAR